MIIVIQDQTVPTVVSIGERPTPAVYAEVPVADGEPEQPPVLVTPAETDAEFRARMIALHVPSGAQHLVNPVLPDGVPPERWGVDWQSGAIAALPPIVTIDDVAGERERRLALGFDYDFGDARGVHHIGTSKADVVGWSEVSTYAGALIDSGDVTTQIMIATDTGPCAVTAPEWRAVEIASAEFRQPLWSRSFMLMAMSPIPAGYQDDSYWT